MGHLTPEQRYDFSILLRHSGDQKPYSSCCTSSPCSSSSSSFASSSISKPKSKPLYLASRNSNTSTPLPLCPLHKPLNTNLLRSLHTRLSNLLYLDPDHHFKSGDTVLPTCLSVRARLQHHLPHLTAQLPNSSDFLTRLNTAADLLYAKPGPNRGRPRCSACSLSKLLHYLPGLYALRVAEYIRVGRPDGGRLTEWLSIWISIAEVEMRLPYHCADHICNVGYRIKESLSSKYSEVMTFENDAAAMEMAWKVKGVMKRIDRETGGAQELEGSTMVAEVGVQMGLSPENGTLVIIEKDGKSIVPAELDSVQPEVTAESKSGKKRYTEIYELETDGELRWGRSGARYLAELIR